MAVLALAGFGQDRETDAELQARIERNMKPRDLEHEREIKFRVAQRKQQEHAIAAAACAREPYLDRCR